MSQTTEIPTLPAPTIGDVDIERLIDEQDPYKVILWNDDVNTFQSVIEALVEIFSHSEQTAARIAWDAHENGRAVAAVRPRLEAERSVQALHARKLQATLEPA